MSSAAEQIVAACRGQSLTVATAESLTAGLVASALADVPGASAVLLGGVVAYSSQVKASVLGVSADLLERAGSVDAQVARQMAAGARRRLHADIAVSTTGVAGPEPHDGKPVGTVFIGLADGAGSISRGFRFTGDRAEIRAQACAQALAMLGGHVARTRR
ncbi:Nicotinamide-nucleotide amidohydrolase PncC [Arthrobacter saudimassiliensis]|uniref:Nicotinamide-nucleotide amidohydrolase PncC n=1 Tax=Arthrobacter saudimassiliensis TaxID=1461584 RepID=A0A078MN08_9MICC|nr:Nicotinamide-nucleotide amidohydrolase PncC [Arthrobacter saudimassiliensis]